MIDLRTLIGDLAASLSTVDQSRPVEPGKSFRPGIGPLSESTVIRLAFDDLAKSQPDRYSKAAPCRYPSGRTECDIVIPGHWALEFKLARPFGDNGKPAERWSENLLYPYPGNTSTIGDCLKLLDSGFPERKAVVVLGYEHTPPRIALEPALKSFEVIASEIVAISLSPRVEHMIQGLVHPHHQQLRVSAWEVLGTRTK